MSFFRLVSIEHFKMWKRLSTRILFIMVLLMAVGCTVLANYSYNQNNPHHTAVTDVANWKQTEQTTVQSAKAAIKAAEKSSGVASKMLIGSEKLQLAEAQYRLKHNIAPKTGQTSVWGWMEKMETKAVISDYPAYITIIALFAVIFVSACVAGEYTEGTMKMMISRPFSRSEILTSKLAVSAVYALEMFAAFLIVEFLGLGITLGFGDMGAKALLWTGSQILYLAAPVKLLALYGLDFLSVLFYVIFALLLSVLFRSRSLATGISIFMLLIGGSIFMLLIVFFGWAKYIPFGLTTYSLFLIDGSLLPGVDLGFALLVSGLYAAAFLIASYFVFQKRDI